jgi:hypothetical protein
LYEFIHVLKGLFQGEQVRKYIAGSQSFPSAPHLLLSLPSFQFPSFLPYFSPLLYIITNYSESTMPIIYMSAHRECLTQTSYWRYHMLSLARSDVKIDPEVWASIIRLHYETKKHEKTEREMSQNFYMLGYSLVST